MNNHYVDWMGFAKPTKDLHLKLSYLLLQQADLLLTTLAIPAGFTELNPLMANLLNTPQKLLMFKLVIPLFVAWLIPGKLLIPAIALLALVIGWNLKELLILLA